MNKPSEIGKAFGRVKWQDSFCSSNTAVAMMGLMAGVRARVCIEIGTWTGFSSAAIGYTLDALGGGFLVSCDIYEKCCNASKDAIKDAPNVKHVVLRAYSKTVDWKAVLAEHGYTQACLGFVDGDHEYPSCRTDLERVSPVIRPGGLIVVHDYSVRWPGVPKACDEFYALSGWNRLIIPNYPETNGVGACVFQRPPLGVNE